MVTTHSITTATAYYEKSVQSKKENTVKTNNTQTVKSSEDKLSTKAKNYLDNLRKTYGDYDFIIADAGDDKKALLDKSDKEFSVMLSSDELERMASDEKYAAEKMNKVKTIVEMSNRICEQFGFGRAWGNGNESDTILNKLAVSINDDGTISILAELEKVSEKQKDYIEKIKEKRAEDKKAEDKKLESAKKEENTNVKKVVVEATSEEELIEKIGNIDWNKVSGKTVGVRFDFFV